MTGSGPSGTSDGNDNRDDGLPPDPFPGDPFDTSAAPPPVNADTSGGPFGAMFGDMLRMAGAHGPLNWDLARQVAVWSAAGGLVEPNVEPLERIRLEELCAIAEPHVAAATGLTVSRGRITVQTMTRAGWAAQALDDFRPLLERLAAALGGSATGGSATGEAAPAPDTDPMAGLTRLLAPMLVGMQAGSLVGHLATTSLATYDLPIPRPASDAIGFVPANIAAFASEWTIPIESARMHVCLAELTTHAVLRIEHVHRELGSLLGSYAGAFRIDPDAMGEQLGSLSGFDPNNPSSIERILGDPRALLGAVETAEQRTTRARIDVLFAVIAGYVEHIVGSAGARVLGDNRMVMEAWKRRRINSDSGQRLVGELFGLSLSQERHDVGVQFIGGVLERAGSDGLGELWNGVDHIPTANELVAPGLWLARIGH